MQAYIKRHRFGVFLFKLVAGDGIRLRGNYARQPDG